ncbi:MAG: hypothetical protein ACK5SX_05940, partial [Sandaracinobacter sp.]
FLHSAAYWLMWSLRQALPQTAALRTAEFASACPDAALFRAVPRCSATSPSPCALPAYSRRDHAADHALST